MWNGSAVHKSPNLPAISKPKIINILGVSQVLIWWMNSVQTEKSHVTVLSKSRITSKIKKSL
jgi:hypothetical protein